MAIPMDQFWRSNVYEHPPLTDEMVVIAEQALKIKLPEEYLALLRLQNGGETHGFGFPMSVQTSCAKDHVPFSDMTGIVIDPEICTAQNILDTENMTQEWDLPPRQALLCGDGHWWITLDYRQGDRPSVAWIDVECDQDTQVAPSFAAFLEGLVPIAQIVGP